MEAKFAQLEALVISMVAHVKSTASRLGKVKDREDGQSYGLNVDLGFFCGVGFSRLVTPNEMMPHMLKNHESWWVVDDGNHAMVPNFSEMISINAQVPETTSVDERLDPQLGEIQH